MALVPIIQPPFMRLLTTQKERLIRMKPPRAVSSTEKIVLVKTAHIRAVDFEPFAFRINGEALPELLEDYQFKDKDETKGNRGKFDPYRDITEQQHRICLLYTSKEAGTCPTRKAGCRV